MKGTIVAIALLCASTSFAAKFTNYAENRTTIVHLLEWKWNDIADECERFLGPMGYAGVQVSPVQENVLVDQRPWWERYQPISYRWETRSGNADEFRGMVRRCKAVGVHIYVDVLLNHMAANNPNDLGTGGSSAKTKELDFPAVPYHRDCFHPVCEVNNYKDPNNVRNCELVGLHDLDQSQEYVREKLVGFLNELVSAGVAGFRVDAAKHMWPKDLEIIYSRVKDLPTSEGFPPNTRPFVYQEVIDYGGEAVSKTEYNHIGAVTEFKFGRELSNAFLGRNPLKWFVNWGEPWGLLPSSDALVFIDNHDTQRESGDIPLTYKNRKLYKMAVAMMLAHPYGNPQVMSSFDFQNRDQGPPADGSGNIISPSINPDKSCGNGWVCEHRWRQIYNMVGFRNYVGDAGLTNWWDNDNYQISFCRGNRGFVAINADHVDLQRKLKVCLPSGTYCDIISGEKQNNGCTGKTIVVDGNGEAVIEIRTNEDDGVVATHAGMKVA